LPIAPPNKQPFPLLTAAMQVVVGLGDLVDRK